MEPESTVSIPIARLHEALPTHKRGAHASSAGTRISGLAENHSSGTACRHEALCARRTGRCHGRSAYFHCGEHGSRHQKINANGKHSHRAICRSRHRQTNQHRQAQSGVRGPRHHRGLHRLRTRGRITSQRHARQQTRPSGSVQRGTVATLPASRRLPSILPRGHRSAVGDRKSGLGSRRAR